MTRAIVAALALSVLFAGCIGGPADDSVPTTPDGTQGNDSTTSPDTGPGQGTGDGTATPVTNETETIDWAGAISGGACLPAGPNSCTGPQLPSGDDDRHDTGISDATFQGTLNLTWQASSPTMEELVISVAAVHETSCGETCTSWTYNNTVRQRGTSPVTLTFEDIAVNATETFRIEVHAPGIQQDPLYGYVHTPQDFHVEGVLTYTTTTADA